MPLVDYHDESFFPYLAFGSRVKVMYQTKVIRMRAGYEERVGEWQDALRTFDITPALRDQTDLNTVLDFFYAREGKKYAFKITDPLDHQVTAGHVHTGNAVRTTFQLIKRYTSGLPGDSYYTIRPIVLPDNPISIYLNGVLQSSGYTVNYETGVVTFTSPPGNGVVITWTGTFQVPVRFEQSMMATLVEVYQRFEWRVSLIEQRGPVDTNILSDTQQPDFVDVQIPAVYSERSSFGTQFDVVTIDADSGQTNIVQQSTQGKTGIVLEQQIKTLEQAQAFLNFFHARRGRLTAFRAKDLNDYQVTNSFIATTNGTTMSYQLTKSYISGANEHLRNIIKPIISTVQIELDAVPIAIPYDIDEFGTLLFTLGNLTLTFNDSPKEITRSTGSWNDDGIVSGQKIAIDGSISNDGTYTVDTVVSPTVLTIVEALVDESSVVCTVNYAPLTGQDITWSCEFDIPVRFDTDEVNISVDGYEVHNIDPISMIEIDVRFPEISVLSSGPSPVFIPTGCVVGGLPEVDPVENYINLPSKPTVFQLELPIGLGKFLFNGARSVTVGFAISHYIPPAIGNDDRLFWVQQEGVDPNTLEYHTGMSIAINEGSAIAMQMNSGAATFETSLTGSWNCVNATPVPNIAKFSAPVFRDKNNMGIYCFTFDWVPKWVFASGSGSGFARITNEFAYNTCLWINAGTEPTLVGETAKDYYVARDGGGSTQPGNDSTITNNVGFFSPDMALRCYEIIVVINKNLLPSSAIVKYVHRPIINFFAGLYGTGFTRIKNLSVLSSTVAWWRADTNVTIDGTNHVESWVDVVSGLEIIPSIGTNTVQQFAVTTLPPLTDTLRLARVAEIKVGLFA